MLRIIESKFNLKRQSYWWISDFKKKENITITEIDNCLNRYSVTMLLTNELLRLSDLEKINWS